MDGQLHGEGMNPPWDQSMEKAEFHLQGAGVVPWVEIPAELPLLSTVAAQNIQGGFSFLPAHFSFQLQNSLGVQAKVSGPGLDFEILQDDFGHNSHFRFHF